MKSCLIVDDSKVIRKVARHILETLEFEVDEAGDGQEALSEPSPVRAAMGEGWERVSQGMVDTETGPLLLVDVAGLIAGAAEAKAA